MPEEFDEYADGGVLAGGSWGTTFPITGSGGVTIAGNSTSNQSVVFDLEGEWYVNAYVFFDLEANWGLGEQPLSWYRVQGCCNYPTAAGSGLPTGPQYPGGCDVMGIQTDDANCVGAIGKQQFIQNILARSVIDVCNELTRSKLRWQICSIKKWSRPADPTYISSDDTCNTLTEVPYSSIPECIEFVLQTKATVMIGVTITLYEDFQVASSQSGKTRLSYVGGSYLDGMQNIVTGPTTVQTLSVFGNAATIIQSGGTTPTTNEYFFGSNGGAKCGGVAVVAHLSQSGVSKDLAEYLVSIDCKVFIPDNPNTGLPFEEIIFGEPTITTASLLLPTGIVTTACGSCDAMPLNIYMQHNLANAGVLNNFLIRNGLTFSNVLQLSYNSNLSMWVAVQHFNGIADDNANTETWRFTFDLDCTNEVAGESTGASVIKFGVTVTRKNNYTNVVYDSRIMILLPSIDTCNFIRNFYTDLNISLNTKTNYILNDAQVVPDTVILYDKIGMFATTYWNKNPEILLRFSRQNMEIKYDRRNIGSLFPKAVSYRGVGSQVSPTPTAIA